MPRGPKGEKRPADANRQRGPRRDMQQYVGPPMTLGNMRENGLRSLAVSCPACHRRVALNVDDYGDAIPAPAFGPRMVCSGC